MKEIWKPVLGYPNYQVSNLGRVKSVHRRWFGTNTTEIILTPIFIGSPKYPHVRLYENKKHMTIRVSRLVYSTFVGPIPDKMVIDHKDHNVLNNNTENLRLATYSQNSCNQKLKNGKTTRGIWFARRPGRADRWRAQITHQGKNYKLGSYVTQEEAQEAYNKASEMLHKEFGVKGHVN